MVPKTNSISIIIPVYNEEKYISDCLLSLANQTTMPDEIIVVDDGSTDKSNSVVDNLFNQLKTKIKTLKHLKQKHSGVSRARNRGAKAARGEILVFVDADMKFDKGYLRNLIKPIIDGSTIATFTKEEYVANSDNIWSKCWSINNYLDGDKRIPKGTSRKSKSFRAVTRKMFFKTLGYSDVGYGEDSTVLTQLNGVYAKAAPGALCYHFNPESLGEVFGSARWFGRGDTINKSFSNILIFTFPNSIRRGVVEGIKHKLPAFVVFKIVFDFGVILGVIERLLFGKYYK